MIPLFNDSGFLPPGVHPATLAEIDARFGRQSEVRRVANLLTRDALWHAQRLDLKAALASCRASLNAARSLGDEPVALSQLIRTVCVVNACQALERALATRRPSAGLIHHSDRGVQYASADYVARLEDALGVDRVGVELAAGAVLPVKEAITLALAELADSRV